MQSLPFEIRERILEHCLCVDGDILPFPGYYEGTRSGKEKSLENVYEWVEARDIPDPAVTAVNKVIRKQAMAILFGKNTWRLSYVHNQACEPEDATLGIGLPEREFWERFGPLVKHLTVQFNVSDRSMLRTMSATRLRHRGEIYCPSNLHSLYSNLQKNCWSPRGDVIAKISLRTLVIGFENLYCPSYCCREDRIHWFATDIFCKLCASTCLAQQDPKITVSGLRSEEEKKEFRKWWCPGINFS